MTATNPVRSEGRCFMTILARTSYAGLFGSFLLMGHAYAQPQKEPQRIDVDSILAHPLFEPDRQPKGRGAVQAGEPQVVGISGHPGGWRAIIRTGASGSRGKVVAAGDKVSDWSIVEISAGGVTLKRGQSVRHLAPVFAKHSSQAASRPPGATTPSVPPSTSPAAPVSGQSKPTFHFDPASGEAP